MGGRGRSCRRFTDQFPGVAVAVHALLVQRRRGAVQLRSRRKQRTHPVRPDALVTGVPGRARLAISIRLPVPFPATASMVTPDGSL
jgi:hypothetical protein